MFPNWTLFLLKYYSLFGFHSLPFARIGGKSGNLIIFLFHVMLCVWCSICTFTSFVAEQASMEFIDSLNFFSYYIASVTCYWFIIYDSYTHRKFEQQFWNIIRRIDECFYLQDKFKMWDSLTVLLLILAGDMTVLITALVNANSIGSPSSVIMHFILLSIFDHRISFFILHLKVIEFQLDKINSELKHMKKFDEIYERIGKTHRATVEMDKHEQHRFKWIRDYYELVYHMTG